MLVAICLGAGLLVTACPEENEPAASYTVRGQLADIPEDPGEQLVIHHEAVEGFQNRKGKEVGMHAMTMAFGRADDVDVSGLSEGDKIHFTFEVHWKKPQPLRVTRIEKLPADTALKLAKPSHPRP